MVMVKVFGYLIDIVGWTNKSIDVKNSIKLYDLLEAILRDNDLRRILQLVNDGQVKILSNGVEIKLNDWVFPSDEIAIIPLPSGG